ncbi:MAG: (Fe-S)-binding protein [Desulfobacteria bacterium]|nr:(Fe-S)-binding protein [Deltaproteobacteria bacterium]
MKAIGREILWNLPPQATVVPYLLLVVLLLLFAFGICARIRFYRRGRAEGENRLDRLWERARDLLRLGICQKRVLEKKPGGPIHLAVYGAFLALFFVTCLVAVEHDLGVRLLDGDFYIAFKLFAETSGILLAGGVVAALARRCVLRPSGASRERGDLLPLLLLGAIALTGFLVEALRIAATHPAAAPYSYAANAVSPLLAGVSIPDLLRLHRGVWWGHLAVAFGFLMSIPYGKMLHAVAGPANIFLRSYRPAGSLQPIPDFDARETIGAGAVEAFSWKQLLDLDACARCGRCEEVCPAHATGKTLSPQKMIRDLRAASVSGEANRRGDGEDGREGPMIEGLGVRTSDVWACTTCGHCVTSCPVMVEHVEKVVDMRRHLVLAKSDFPPELEQMFRKLELFSDPWGFGPARRTEWAAGLDLVEIGRSGSVDLLYWVGCAGAYEERYRNAAVSLARILKESGIRFGILGSRESCCGDFARRTGNEYLFRHLARKNMAVLEEHGVKKIVTPCPHCYNSLKNEYPAFGGRFEVLHHSELILELMENGGIRTRNGLEKSISYHDPCYLGRCNGIFDPPRRVLSKIPGVRLAEAGRSRENSFCCGAGGGYLWLPEHGSRINDRRSSELVELKPDIVATACPHCMYMLEDGMASAEGGGRIPESLDLAEIVLRSM